MKEKKKINEEEENQNDTLYKKFLMIKKIIATFQIIITKICNFFEKIKNLFSWEEPIKTTTILIILILSFFFVGSVKIKYLFFLLCKIKKK